MSDKRKTRILLLSSLILTLLFIYISTTWLVPTLSRYIKREQDEIRAHYTALYFASTGEGKTITLENGVGYIDFELRNYINENVTQRDIEYTISQPSVFYDSTKAVISDPDTYEGNLYVKDVWENLQLVGKSSSHYQVEIVQNNGEIISTGVYAFTYEKLATGAKGKVHTLTCKITADDGYEVGDNDQISLVVQLSKPYKEVLIINMKISTKLISFSHKEINVFNVPFDKIYVQTADLFAYYKNNTVRTAVYEDKTYQFTSYAFKLTIDWTGYILDELKLEDIHMGSSPGHNEIGKYDTVDSNGAVLEGGTTPNPDNAPYIDITKSTIAAIDSEVVNNVNQGSMVIYVPQGSDIFFHFLKTGTSGSINVKIEVYLKVEDNAGYYLYDNHIGGYEHTNEKYKLAEYEN